MRFAKYIKEGLEAEGIPHSNLTDHGYVRVGPFDSGVTIMFNSRSVSVSTRHAVPGGTRSDSSTTRFTGRGWRKRMLRFVKQTLALIQAAADLNQATADLDAEYCVRLKRGFEATVYERIVALCEGQPTQEEVRTHMTRIALPYLERLYPPSLGFYVAALDNNAGFEITGDGVSRIYGLDFTIGEGE